MGGVQMADEELDLRWGIHFDGCEIVFPLTSAGKDFMPLLHLLRFH